MKSRIIFQLTIQFLIVFICACEKKTSTPDIVDSSPLIETKNITIPQVIEGDLVMRPVIIQAPNIIEPTKKYPVVFAFHGRGGTNTSWINTLSSYTNNGEFIGVYPQGFLESWNLGQEPSKADDVDFINLIVEELQNYTNLNFDKMYAIGTSNGSGMVNKLGIETSHFKAIAPIVSQLMESSVLHSETQPISVFQINGAADSVIPINGGPKFGHVFLDAAESARLWATHFNCNQNPEIVNIGDDTLYIYLECNANKEIRYLRVENGGHGLLNSSMINDIWIFFQRF